MNGRAAAKAVGVYLAILVPVGAWIAAIVWAASTGAGEGGTAVAALAPLWLLTAVGVLYIAIWAPLQAMYDHFDRKGGK